MSSIPSAPGPRYPVLLDLLRTADTLWNASRAFFEPFGLSPSQFNLLNLIADSPNGRTPIDLSRELLMHRSNVTGLVDRLHDRSLVQRQAQPGDRRSHRIVLTPAGRRLLASVLPYFHQAAEQVWGRLTLAEIRRIQPVLAHLRENATRMTGPPHPPGDSARHRASTSAAPRVTLRRPSA